MILRIILVMISGLFIVPNTSFSDIISKVDNPNSNLFISDGVPPHSISSIMNSRVAQKKIIYFEIPKKPSYEGRPKYTKDIGITIDGVLIKHEKGDCYDLSCSENYDLAYKGIMTSNVDHNFGKMDLNNIYYYLGAGSYLRKIAKSNVVIGIASDGFPIHYSPNERSSYKLKIGKRTLPNSKYESNYDGKLYSDYEYKKGTGTLDQCNGRFIDNVYTYFVTEEFPYTPPCLMGESYYRVMLK